MSLHLSFCLLLFCSPLAGLSGLVPGFVKVVGEYFRRVMALLGAEEPRTDEPSVYKHVVDEEDHQICLAHWRRSNYKRAADPTRQSPAEAMLYESETILELKRLTIFVKCTEAVACCGNRQHDVVALHHSHPTLGVGSRRDGIPGRHHSAPTVPDTAPFHLVGRCKDYCPQ